jgi:hypothetical protein
MSEISSHEKEIWKKYIIGISFYKIEIYRDGTSYNFEVRDWEYNSPSFIIKARPRKYSACFYILYRKNGIWKFRSGVNLMDFYSDDEFGTDLRFPSIENCLKPDLIFKTFEEGIKRVKEKLSFLKNVYLKSKYLPKELVAHIFSFVRRCEIEKK